MKKYIRTKDRVWESEDYWKRTPTEIMGLKEEIIKQADTIKELCDERVLTRYFDETKYIHHEILPKTQWDMMAKSVAARLANGITDCNYYGAIWADKGLIYVAKMNEKEELELIQLKEETIWERDTRRNTNTNQI